jgi:hypothetical protein
MNSIESLPPPTSEARRQLARDNAQKLLARRRRRLSKIRKRAVVGSVAAFAAAWAAIGFQLVSGHDPALSKGSQVAMAKTSKPTSTKSSSAISASTDSGSTDSGSTGSTTTASSPAAPVTTRQS